MTITHKIWDKTLHINGEAAEIAALSSAKIGKCEYPTGQEIVPLD